MQTLHLLRTQLLECAKELGRVPTRDEFVSLKKVQKNHLSDVGGFSTLLQGCGLSRDKKDLKKKEFKYFRPKVDSSVFSHTERYDLQGLFDRKGNPEFMRVAFMPDTHLEEADPWALNCFIEYLVWRQPDLLIIGGDFLNASGISHWGNNGLHPERLMPEVIKARELLSMMKGLLPNTEIIYLEGNHEDWINQFMRHEGNPKLFDGLQEIGLDPNLSRLLDLEKLKIKLYPLNKIVRIGKAGFTHGLFTGDNHARTHIMRAKISMFYGHNHDSKSYVDSSADGTVIAQSLMCLCSMNPPYLRGLLNNWEQGFGDFLFFKNGDFIHIAPKILRGVTSVDGKLIRA